MIGICQRAGWSAATRVRPETIDCSNADGPSALSAKREKALIVFDIGNNADRMRTGRPRSQQ